jgi:hypothetical protein
MTKMKGNMAAMNIYAQETPDLTAWAEIYESQVGAVFTRFVRVGPSPCETSYGTH